MHWKIIFPPLVLTLNVSLFAYAQNSPTQNQPANPLTSKPDVGTILDESKAAKARQLVEYIITRPKQKGLLHYDPHYTNSDEYQSVQVVMKVDEWNYTVWVANRQEGTQNTAEPDTISFELRPAKAVKAKEKGKLGKDKDKDRTKNDKVITFTDTGLDGRCDFGLIPRGMSENGQEWLYQPASRYFPQPIGEEHQPHFQKLYEETLERLVKFYGKR